MRRRIAILGLAWLSLSAPASARTIIVAKGLLWDGKRPDTEDIQQAIDLAEAGDIVEVQWGDWALDAPLDFRGKPITVRSNGVRLRVSKSPRNPKIACVVFFGSRETQESVLEGFVLEGGPGYYGLGGAIYCDSPASPTIRNCEIRWNAAGAAVVLTGTARFIDCKVSDCSGIAVYCGNRSRPVLSGCRIQGNSAGGAFDCAVYCDDDSAVTLVNCLLTDNQGDGIYCGETRGSSVTVRSSTIAGNGGAGIVVDAGSRLSLDSSIVWGNGGGAIRLKPAAAPPEIAFSCVEGPGAWPGEGNIAEDPLLVSFGIMDWSHIDPWTGKPDFTIRPGDYRLLQGSPAIDAGNPAGAPETDVDGNGRPCGERADMGAVEVCTPVKYRFIRGDCDLDGRINITDGLRNFWLLFFCGCGDPCEEACDSNDDGQNNITDGVYILNYLFLGGAEPPPPGPLACGADPPGSPELWCDYYPPCE